MKKVIKGKLYDTDTAPLMGEWWNGLSQSDFGYCAEQLYKKRTGEFFLHGEGGAMSKYARHSGNNSGFGERITPLTYAEAQEWVEEHLDGDKYIEIFGIPDEDDSKEDLHICLTKTAIAKVKQAAGLAGITVSEYIEQLING